ncbi:MAG TPA: ChaN family lipoprotein [Thermoanaerobaculia bacterium]|nr:ChaN family lipoprotein [Thermoanaerobaculia bacterium]
MRSALSVFLGLLFLAPLLPAADKTLHLPLGDPARKDRRAPLVLDGVTDTRTGDVLTPADLGRRLGDVRLLLVGESHTDMDFHRAQLRVIEELARSGRKVLIGLEMYPYTAQEHLNRWVEGRRSEEAFLRTSRWYEHWGYHWDYYRDIFLFARDHKIPMFALNAPREVVNRVRQKGFEGLTPEEAAHIPRDIETGSAEHRTLFKSFFETDDPIHAGMTDEQWDSMVAAQATWDATMAHNAVKALREHGGKDGVMVVLVGSGHVAYGLGIQRQAARWLDGRIASIIPINVKDGDGDPVETAQASYADFLWGLPPATDPLHPSLGLSTVVGEKALRVIFVTEKSPAARAGFKTGDVLLTMDGTPLPDKETLNRLMAGKEWGDGAVFKVQRGEGTVEVPVVLRRTLPPPP